ncbi:aromatic ring-hydroxylating oxygenase subunit alpha [Lichenihabitans psoromatis]|uniref:aromatic ring-hydroxylating oxygenase subunit alpha n=1 Tax=Lichenihabitans psoromatis TaxID=2528642 RepID=UPI00103841D1|nr:aromatic ring-hydroxylating dioxygenase subunit alpha [Lichenihabitans psoromatis]
MTARQDMISLLKNRKVGFSLPQPFYNDPEFFKLDMENIWYKDWLFAGHDIEINEPGQWFTMQVGAYPLIIIRGRDGEIRALHNSCRHRGSIICKTEHGSSKRLVCPYHQWSYDTDGSLLRARHAAADFDKSGYGLKQAHCETVGGYIFVCVAQNAPDFAPFRAQALPYLAPHKLGGDVKIATQNTIVENGNWKLVWENNRECYHCAANHPELCRTFPEAPTVTGVTGAMDDPIIKAHWDKCEAAGLPSTFVINPTGQFRHTRAPLIEGVESYTMSGKTAVARPLCDDVTTPQIGTMLMFHYPTTWNHVLGDHAISFRVLPIDATHTAVTTKWLVHKDAQEGVDYHLDELTAVWNATNDQDRRVVEDNQFGINSPAYEPGPYLEPDEGGVAQFVEWYTNAMDRSLNGDRATLSRVA